MRRSIFCAILVCAGLTACGAGEHATVSNASNSNTSNAPFRAANAAMPAGDADENMVADAPVDGVKNEKISLAQTTASAINTAPTDRKVIRNAELNLEAENPEDAQRKITTIAEQNGGFVVESQQSSSDIQATSRDIVTMSVRVPSERFAETLESIRNVSSRVVVETVKGQDVTEEFIDIEAQLKAKRALEQQFMEIMKRANTVQDALDIQRQLAGVRGEIERVEGRKRFLENQSSLSTIKIRLQTAKVFAAASAGFGSRLGDAFGAGFDVALSFVLGLVTFVVAVLPFAIFVCLPLFIVIRYFWRRQTRPRTVIELAEGELKST